jgi:hypothetical protein
VLSKILVRQAPQDQARRLPAGLRDLGLLAFATEVRQVPTDAQRIVSRQLEWTSTGFAVTDGRGACHDCPSPSIALFQPGHRPTSHSELVKSTDHKFSMGRALLTRGLFLSKKVVTVTEQVISERESFILVVRAEGLPAIILYESRLGFQRLGVDIKAARHLNLKALLERLRALAPAPVDDRAAQPTYLRGLPRLGVDEADLGLFLVQAARNL